MKKYVFNVIHYISSAATLTFIMIRLVIKFEMHHFANTWAEFFSMKDPPCASLFLSNTVGNQIKRNVDDVNCDEKKASCLQLMTSVCQDQLNAEFSKVFGNVKVCSIESLKCPESLHSVIVAKFPRP